MDSEPGEVTVTVTVTVTVIVIVTVTNNSFEHCDDTATTALPPSEVRARTITFFL
jgi:hypothetical protein